MIKIFNNNKGYLLIELILASALAMMVAYFLLNLVIKISNRNQDLYTETVLLTDKAIMTNAIMEDINKYTLVKLVDKSTIDEIIFEFTFKEGNNTFLKTLNIKKDNATISYGDFKKSINKNISNISVDNKEEDFSNITSTNDKLLNIKISMKTLYSNTDYGINLVVPYNSKELSYIEIIGVNNKNYNKGDYVNYAGLKWKVIKDNGTSITMILAENYAVGKYSNECDNSKWITSNVKTQLNETFVNGNKIIKNDVLSGGIIKDIGSESHIRLITKEEISSEISNDSDTPFWSMTSFGNDILYAKKDGEMQYKTYQLEDKIYYQGGVSVNCSPGCACGWALSKITKTIANSQSTEILKDTVTKACSEKVSLDDQLNTENVSGYYATNYKSYTNSGPLESVYYCGVNGPYYRLNYDFFYGRCVASNNCKNDVKTYTVIENVSSIGIRPVITVVKK